MIKTTNKILWIIISLFIFNWLLTMFGLSPFGWHYFFPDYYDDVRYWSPAWLDNEQIVFMKGVSNWRMETPFLIFGGRRPLDYKTYLCSMKIDGTGKREILEIPKEFKPEYITYDNGIIILSENKSDGKIAVVKLDTNEFNIISDGREADVSSDGRQIAYVGQGKNTNIIREHIHGNDIEQISYGNNGIWIMDIYGQNQLQITDNPGDAYPLWSSDGKLIAFKRIEQQNISSIWTIDIISKKYMNIANGSWIEWINNNLLIDNRIFDIKGNCITEMKQSLVASTKGTINLDYYHFYFDNTKKYILTNEGNNSSGIAYFDQDGVRKVLATSGVIVYGKANRKVGTNIWTDL